MTQRRYKRYARHNTQSEHTNLNKDNTRIDTKLHRDNIKKHIRGAHEDNAGEDTATAPRPNTERISYTDTTQARAAQGKSQHSTQTQ
ncbi:hypothetical protein E2C01_055680 [Portunus trituberculatus]|uniref:Uncharacterized protein n=1 Tax=Portunus trituberculatus TaxID=210409 RepID=A0A5B7GVF3_PORTR|nr:hypothetical protein [Portunus trituberculatus]